MFERIDGLRIMELGEPGSELQKRLNVLVLSGEKTGTSSIDDGEYEAEGESFEVPGEREWLVDGEGRPLALIEYTAVQWVPFEQVGWQFVQSEGEGFESVEQWRVAHRAFWTDVCGIEITNETPVICYNFKVIEKL
jgi:uncharacterized protein YhfF